MSRRISSRSLRGNSATRSGCPAIPKCSAERMDADKWRGFPARELLERTDRVGEGGRRGEVGRKRPRRAAYARVELRDEEDDDGGRGHPPERPERRGDVLGHQVSPGSKGLEDRAGTGLLGEPHDDGPEPVWDEEYDQPSEIDHETLASGYGARGGEGSAGGSTRPSALSNCPSGVPPSGTSASTTAKRRLSSGSRIAWAANCSVRGMNHD